uniref:Uncharacterized protein n=1 Tax=Panagrolaimus superbus TaxID=310955 RepID=A0A914YM99_9BILA
MRRRQVAPATGRRCPDSAVSPGGGGHAVNPTSSAVHTGSVRIRSFPLWTSHGRCQPVRPARRYRHPPRRCLGPDQGRGEENRRRAGRRPGAERAAGHRGQRQPRTAGGVGGGQGLAGQQGDPGARSIGDQCTGGVAAQPWLERAADRAIDDDRRYLPLLRGRGEAGASLPAFG